ncbi:MAG TPA: uracil-DNA glycosylase [Bacteroidetes bacterium]|nr:uracil-DNA glycosylase [Bacteroidota bacterium]HRR09090.1 uracil-DNA glycosylase [Rhodothermales bacterium]
MADVKIEPSWKAVLAPEFEKLYFQNIRTVLHGAKAAGKILYPPGPLIFNAFNKVPFEEVKVVILGQDPYHQPGQAMGLSFSVPKGIRIPPSLINIYKELHRDLSGFVIPPHGDLSEWAAQGVFLLNAMLSVEKGVAGSHAKIGWQDFTNAVIHTLSERRNGLVFMLWGNFAKQKKQLIHPTKHLILEAAHPSPLAGNAFSGCAHFSKANHYLQSIGKTAIDWRIAP